MESTRMCVRTNIPPTYSVREIKVIGICWGFCQLFESIASHYVFKIVALLQEIITDINIDICFKYEMVLKQNKPKSQIRQLHMYL